jgi:hypothetical protein
VVRGPGRLPGAHALVQPKRLPEPHVPRDLAAPPAPLRRAAPCTRTRAPRVTSASQPPPAGAPPVPSSTRTAPYGGRDDPTTAAATTTTAHNNMHGDGSGRPDGRGERGGRGRRWEGWTAGGRSEGEVTGCVRTHASTRRRTRTNYQVHVDSHIHRPSEPQTHTHACAISCAPSYLTETCQQGSYYPVLSCPILL